MSSLNLRDLSARVPCSESLLSKIENEKAVASLQMLHRIVSQRLAVVLEMAVSSDVGMPETLGTVWSQSTN